MCLLTRSGHAVPVRGDRGDAAVGQVVDVVEAGDVDPAGGGQAQQQLVAPARAPVGLPGLDDLGDGAHGLLAVAEHRHVDEVGDRLGVEGGVAAGHHHRVGLVAVGGVQRDAGQVERGEQVGVAEFGRERDAEQVERPDRAVGVDGELRDAVLAQQRLEIRPDRVGALGERVVTLVEDLVEDLHALVRQAHLVGVGVHQRPPDRDGVPVLAAGVQFTPDVLDRLAHPGQQRLQAIEQRLDRHARRV